MGYQMDFKEVLLPQWEEWENGVSSIPGKNVELKDSSKGSILVSADGIGIYNAPLDALYDIDIGNVFMEMVQKAEDKHLLTPYLSDSDIEEAFTVYTKYLEREKSFDIV